MSQPRLLPAVYCFLAAFCLGLPHASSQSLPIITSVSGCTDVGSTTWNCTSGMTLTVHGTDFVADEGAHLYFPTSAHGETYCWMNHPITASNLTCNIYTEDRTFQVGDFLDPVAVIFPSIKGDNSRGFYETPAFAGVAFAPIAFPRLDRISGCDDSNNTDGQYTAHCDPETTTLTLTGSGFSMFKEEVSGLPGMLLDTIIGGVRAHLDGEVVSDSTFLIHLARSYTRLISPDHYTGTPLPLSLSVFDRSTNVVFIGFVTPLPPPRIDALLSYPFADAVACQIVTDSGALGGCTPGVSSIVIQGHHFYQPISVYIGGKLCTPVFPPYPTATELYYVVPLLDEYVPGLYYDLVINDTVYADEPEVGVVKSAIAFLPGPTLSGVVPCIATYQPDIAQFPKCSPGHVLTIVGTGFLPADPTAYMNITGIARPFSGQCSSLQVIDNEHLTCTLPDLGSVSEWTLAQMTLYAHGNTSSPLIVYPYDYSNPITVTKLVGCGGQTSTIINGMPTLLNCDPTDIVEIEGLNIPGQPNDHIEVYDSSLNLPLSVSYKSSTNINAALPGQSSLLVLCVPTIYTVRSITYGFSNPFAIVFVPTGFDCPSSSSSSSTGAGGAIGSTGSGGDSSSDSSSSGLSHGGVAGVVIAAVIGALVVSATLVWMCRMRGRKGERGFSSHSDQTDGRSYESSTDAVELH